MDAVAMSYYIVPTEAGHIKLMANRLRDNDIAEIEAYGNTPQKSLWRSYRKSVMVNTVFVDDEIAAIWGVGGSPLSEIGHPWFLTAPPIEKVKIAIVREGRFAVQEMLWTYKELRGYVDSRYTGAVRLLEVLGFSLGEKFPFGPHGVLFQQFTLRRN